MTKQTLLFTLFLILSQNYHLSGQNVHRYPASPDNIDIEANKALIQAELSAENAEQYSLMAISLWNLGKDTDAKKMFLKICYSQLPIFNKKNRRSSDDTASNFQGYGSETEHSKHTATLHLAQIYINEKDYQEALKYLIKADKTYPRTFNCGTGRMMHEEQLRYLYGLCYEGLGQYDNAIQLLLPHCFSWQNQTLIRVLKSKYSQAELTSIIVESLNNINFQLDSHQSTVTRTTNSGTDQEKTQEVSYISGTGTIELLGVEVQIHQPQLEDGDIITKEHFIKEFKQTNFYVHLTGDDSGGYIIIKKF